MHGRARFFIPLALTSVLLFLLVRNSPCLSLALPHLPEINPDSTTREWIRLRQATIFLIGRPEPPYESIKAPPGLPKWTSTRRRGFRLPIKHATLQMNLGLSKLIQVTKKVQNMVAIALRKWNRWSLVLQILSKCTPVPSFLRLIAAKCCCWALLLLNIIVSWGA